MELNGKFTTSRSRLQPTMAPLKPQKHSTTKRKPTTSKRRGSLVPKSAAHTPSKTTPASSRCVSVENDDDNEPTSVCQTLGSDADFIIEQVDSEVMVSNSEAMDVEDAETELSEYNMPVLRLATENQ
jgi:hypothetical protein